MSDLALANQPNVSIMILAFSSVHHNMHCEHQLGETPLAVASNVNIFVILLGSSSNRTASLPGHIDFRLNCDFWRWFKFHLLNFHLLNFHLMVHLLVLDVPLHFARRNCLGLVQLKTVGRRFLSKASAAALSWSTFHPSSPMAHQANEIFESTFEAAITSQAAVTLLPSFFFMIAFL